MSTPHDMDHESFPHEPLEGSIGPLGGEWNNAWNAKLACARWSRRMEWLLASRILGEKTDHWLG